MTTEEVIQGAQERGEVEEEQGREGRGEGQARAEGGAADRLIPYTVSAAAFAAARAQVRARLAAFEARVRQHRADCAAFLA